MRHSIPFLLLLFFGAAAAQTTGLPLYNKGRLYISPNTLLTVNADFVNAASGHYTNDGEVLFKADFINNGTADFEEDGAVTRFEGQQPQEIKGDAAVDYYNIRFNNAGPQPAFILSNPMNVYGEINFTEGIVNNTAHNPLLFKPETDLFNANNSSYVEGFVKKEGATTFSYPVGSQGHYRPAATVLTDETSAVFSVKYHLENSDALYPHQQKEAGILFIDNTEYWEIKTSTPPDDNVFIQLRYDESTAPSGSSQLNPSQLVIVGWNSNKQEWVNLGGSVNANGEVLSTRAPADYTAFTFGVVRESENNDKLTVYNGIDPYDTGGNDHLRIEGIENYPKNKVEIYNRWGVIVYETKHYGIDGNVFRGVSNARATIAKNKELPAGNYFYLIRYYDPVKNKIRAQTGYLYITR